LENACAQIREIKSAELFQFAINFPEKSFAIISVFWEIRKIIAQIDKNLKTENFDAARNLQNTVAEICEKWKKFEKLVFEKEAKNSDNLAN
jgi:hypothetical protein